MAKKDVEILEKQANSLAASGNYLGAGTTLSVIAELNPSDSQRWTQAAEWLAQGGAADKAVRVLQTGVRLNEKNVETRHRLMQALAEHHLGMQRWVEATEVSRQLLRENPRHHGGLELLATALLQTNNLPEAVQAIQALLRLSPRDPLHRLKLATLYQLQGRLGDAMHEFQRVLETQGGFPFTHDALEAIESLDRLQTQQILMMATERGAFRLKLERDFDNALFENGFQLSEFARESLRNMVADLTPADRPAPPRTH